MRRQAETIILVALAVSLSGCASFFYHPRYPVLEKPDRPVLANVSGSEMKKMSPEAQDAVTHNFDALIGYGKRLEIAIDEYNFYANEQNKTLGTGEKK